MKKKKQRKIGPWNEATELNLTCTPIYELIKKRVSEGDIKSWSNIHHNLKNRQTHQEGLTSADKSFFYFVKRCSEAISKDARYEKSFAVRDLNKYETCTISGIRKFQQDLGINPNLNQVTYNTIKRQLKRKCFENPLGPGYFVFDTN